MRPFILVKNRYYWYTVYKETINQRRSAAHWDAPCNVVSWIIILIKIR